jgi:hypothetical protein
MMLRWRLATVARRPWKRRILQIWKHNFHHFHHFIIGNAFFFRWNLRQYRRKFATRVVDMTSRCIYRYESIILILFIIFKGNAFFFR